MMLGSIRSRLLVLAELPVLVVLIILAILIWGEYQEIREMDALTPLGVAIGAFVHEAQVERGNTAGFLSSKGARFSDELTVQRKRTQQKMVALEEVLESFDSVSYGSEFDKALQAAREGMAQIKTHRLQVDTYNVSVKESIDFYTQHNELWIKLIQLSSGLATNSEVSLLRTAYHHFMEGKDVAGIERAVMTNIFAANTFQEGEYSYFKMLIALQNHFFEQLKMLATSEQADFFEQRMSDPIVAEVQRLRDIALTKGEPTAKPRLLSDIYAGFGYGGAIHHFKNLVLRHPPSYKQRFDETYQNVIKALNELEALSATTSEEKKHIHIIRETVEKYQAMSSKIYAMVQAGKSIKEMDKVVKIDDGPALNALHELSALTSFGYFGIKPDYWFNTITKKIDLLKEVEDRLAEDIVERGSQLSGEAQEMLVKLVLLAVIILFLALVTAFLMARNISKPLQEAIQFAERIADNDLEGTIKDNQTGELGAMSRALNRMAGNLRTKISELACNAQVLNLARVEAERANQAKTDFLANMSHELRTPMHSILSFAAMGEEKIETADREKLHLCFSRVQESGERLLTLLDALLDLAKLEAGRMEFNLEGHDLQVVVEAAITEFSELAQKKSLSLKMIPPDVETGAQFDRDKLLQVMFNLLSNAIKFTPEGKEIQVSFASAALPVGRKRSGAGETPAVAVSVVDHGVGIPEEELTQVFDKFIQSSKTKTGGGGTGLGLAICKEIIEGHGGAIRAENNPQGGAVFTFVIPRQTIQDHE